MFRLALIGYGKWGHNHAAAAMGGGAHVVLAMRPGAPVPADWDGEAMPLGVALASCDAVVYAGHPRHSAEIAELVCATRKPLLLEKPAGLCLADAERIAVAESRHSAMVLIGHQHLFAQKFEAMVRDRPSTGVATVVSTGPVKREYSAIWDYGSHAVAMALALNGGASTMGPVNAKGRTVTAWLTRGDRACEVTMGLADTRAIHATKSDLVYDGYEPAEPALTREVRAFIAAAKSGNAGWQFGSSWAVNVAHVLVAASDQRLGVPSPE